MKKTSNYFVIDNFNHLPDEIIDYCEEFEIYDASTDESIVRQLKDKWGGAYKRVNRTGHNISSYFWWIEDNYDSLPDVVCFTKGHMIGRHCSKDYFNKVYDNKYFTPLFSRDVGNVHGHFVGESYDIERNWHVDEYTIERPQRYCSKIDDMLDLLFSDFPRQDYVIFCPGACYIVEKSQILKHSREFYHNINQLINYGVNKGLWPVEAGYAERIMPIIFLDNSRTSDIANSIDLFQNRIDYMQMELRERKELYQSSKLRRTSVWLRNRKKIKGIGKLKWTDM